MTDLQQIEKDIAQCEALIATAEALEALRRNRSFKRVIEEGYLREEAVRNTMLLDNAQYREAAIRALAGIASFQGYLQGVEQMAAIAKDQLVELREAQAEFAVEV